MKLHAILLLCALLLLLTGCQLADKLGFDTYDYMGEPVLYAHAADSETAEMLADFLGILITDSPILPTFDGMADAIRAYRDAVLTDMLTTGYAKYTGNTELIEKTAQAYPEYNSTQIIPAGEFEATMYRYFGGSVKITHKDGSRFRYLDKVGAYISPVAPVESGLSAEVTVLSETAQTYRVWFRVVGEDVRSEEYFALVIKREDGTLYIKKLLESGVE